MENTLIEGKKHSVIAFAVIFALLAIFITGATAGMTYINHRINITSEKAVLTKTLEDVLSDLEDNENLSLDKTENDLLYYFNEYDQSVDNAVNAYITTFPVEIHKSNLVFVALCLSFAILVIVAVFCVLYQRSFLVVTDKRICGKNTFGVRADIPISSITAVYTGLFGKFIVSTSSGKTSFSLIKNANEIHEVVSELLFEIQNKLAEQPRNNTSNHSSNNYPGQSSNQSSSNNGQ